MERKTCAVDVNITKTKRVNITNVAYSIDLYHENTVVTFCIDFVSYTLVNIKQRSCGVKLTYYKIQYMYHMRSCNKIVKYCALTALLTATLVIVTAGIKYRKKILYN